MNEYADVGTHWIALFCNRNEIVYFDSLGVEHVPEDIKEFIGNKNIKVNMFWVQAKNSVMCRYFSIGFIDFMLAVKKFNDFTNLFSPYDFEKNDTLILTYFKDESDSIEAIDRTNLTEQTKFRLDEISKTENYLHEEIN